MVTAAGPAAPPDPRWRRIKILAWCVLGGIALIAAIVNGIMSRAYMKKAREATENAANAAAVIEPIHRVKPGERREFIRAPWGKDFVGDTTPKFALQPGQFWFRQALIEDPTVPSGTKGRKVEPGLYPWLVMEDRSATEGWMQVKLLPDSGVNIIGVRITSGSRPMVEDPSTGDLSPRR